MKTNKIIAIILVIIALIIMWYFVYNKLNYGTYKWTVEYDYWFSKKWNWMWKWNSNLENSINSLSWVSNLTEDEKQILLYWYSEELMAHDIYTYFYELYKVEPFKNISNSEIGHMSAVKTLLDRYKIEVPNNYWKLQDIYETLKTEWEKWLKEALEVWVKIEMLDIEDIVKNIKNTDNTDFKMVFTNIWWASYNHLRWFLKALWNNNYTTNIDYSKYLNSDEINTKWSLQSKILEELK